MMNKEIRLYANDIGVFDQLHSYQYMLLCKGWKIEKFRDSNLLVPEMHTPFEHVGGLKNIKEVIERLIVSS